MTFSIALVNISDGTVQGHKAGCADLSRGSLRCHADEAWELEVEDKAEAWFSYSSDFLAEGGMDNAYAIDWKPCANHVPDGDNQARYDAAFGEDHTPVAYQTEVVTHEDEITMKVGRIWTYVYKNGDLIAEVKTQDAHYVVSLLS